MINASTIIAKHRGPYTPEPLSEASEADATMEAINDILDLVGLPRQDRDAINDKMEAVERMEKPDAIETARAAGIDIMADQRHMVAEWADITAALLAAGVPVTRSRI